jgi:prepilin-type N-terminal cleavage/methylation domain-containing protein
MLRLRLRQGFTVIELTVVMAIIGVLVAILTPAVQKAREAANRTKCLNNIRQLGLACHHSNSVLGSLPPFKAEGIPPMSYFGKQGNNGSWAFFLLPFVEQGPLFDASAWPGPEGTAFDYNVTLPVLLAGGEMSRPVAATTPPTPGARGFVGQQGLKIYQCPSDPTGPAQGRTLADPNGYGLAQPYGACSYAANYLVFGSLLPGPYDSTRRYGASILNPDGYDAGGQPTIAGSNLAKIPASFADGISNTLLFGEKYATCTWYAAGSSSVGVPGGNLWSVSVQSAQWAPAFAMESPWADGTRFQVLPTAADCDVAYAQTGHVGGMVVAMADASARLITTDITNETWIALCTPNGSEIVGPEF